MALTATNGFAKPWDPNPTIQVEAASLAGLSSLSVRSDVRGASVWLDYQLRGSVPLDLTGITPGSHSLLIRADGYYDSSITLILAADTKTTVSAPLLLKTGFLSVSVKPSTASVVVDGNSYAPGIIELKAGQQTVTLKAFGYSEQSFSVYVPERLFYSINAELKKAPFEARDYAISQERFNPRNAGLNGLTRASFRVNAPGSALVVISDPSGETILQDNIGPFIDWNQDYSWRGRDEYGQPLPDGPYTITFTVTPGQGIEYERDEYIFSSTILLDTSLIVIPTGSYGALYGSVFAPLGHRPQANGFRVDALGYATGSLDGSAVTKGGANISFAGAIEGMLEAGLGMEIEEAQLAARLGIRYAAPIVEPYGLGALIEGRVTEPEPGDPAYVRLGAVIGIGSPFINAVLMPHIGAYWEPASSFKTGLGLALSANAYSFGASLSAALGTAPLSDGFFLAWPIRTAIELRLSPPRVPLSFRLMGGIGWSPGPSTWTAGIGISGGF